MLGTILTTRSLVFKADDGQDRGILIEIGQPTPYDQDCAVPFRIRGFGPGKVFHGIGVDREQALHLTLGMIGAELHYWTSHHQGSLRSTGAGAIESAWVCHAADGVYADLMTALAEAMRTGL